MEGWEIPSWIKIFRIKSANFFIYIKNTLELCLLWMAAQDMLGIQEVF